MSKVSAEYYQIKGMASELSAEEQAEVKRAEDLVTELAKSSSAASLGVLLATIKLAQES
ncbi:hypothetical protein [Pseudomonas alabamensis]|uniref:hypothetical protein n=1 Tax=Pseudomonas alabamensis TaxID=3064349 RepID=UPI000B0CFCE3